MRKFIFLTKEMREDVDTVLKSGEVTIADIRKNIEIDFFCEHQDEIIDQMKVNEEIDKFNKKYGVNNPPVVGKPIIVESGDSFVGKETCKTYENSLRGELEYYIDMKELEDKSKDATTKKLNLKTNKS